MTADRRAALVEKVRSLVIMVQFGHASVECTTDDVIDLIRAETLEEAARELERRGFKGLAQVAIRNLKGDT